MKLCTADADSRSDKPYPFLLLTKAGFPSHRFCPIQENTSEKQSILLAIEHLLAMKREIRPLFLAEARPMKEEWNSRPYFGVFAKYHHDSPTMLRIFQNHRSLTGGSLHRIIRRISFSTNNLLLIISISCSKSVSFLPTSKKLRVIFAEL